MQALASAVQAEMVGTSLRSPLPECFNILRELEIAG